MGERLGRVIHGPVPGRADPGRSVGLKGNLELAGLCPPGEYEPGGGSTGSQSMITHPHQAWRDRGGYVTGAQASRGDPLNTTTCHWPPWHCQAMHNDHRLFDHPNKKAPRGGRLSTGCGGHLLTPRTAGRVSLCSRMACLVPDRRGMGITSLGRDARGLTFSAVIPARVMQPGVSTRGKQSWRIALCSYGMTLAPRHRVHLLCVASLAHLRCAHRLG